MAQYRVMAVFMTHGMSHDVKVTVEAPNAKEAIRMARFQAWSGGYVKADHGEMYMTAMPGITKGESLTLDEFRLMFRGLATDDNEE